MDGLLQRPFVYESRTLSPTHDCISQNDAVAELGVFRTTQDIGEYRRVHQPVVEEVKKLSEWRRLADRLLACFC